MSITSKIYILVGPPCSGKSTYAKELARKGFIRINRDDLRKMIKDSYDFRDKDVEKIINKITTNTIIDAEIRNRNVVIDATHCKSSYITDILKTHKENQNFSLVFFNVPLWKLKIRNVIRFIKTGRWIPTNVIERMSQDAYMVNSVMTTECKLHSITQIRDISYIDGSGKLYKKNSF